VAAIVFFATAAAACLVLGLVGRQKLRATPALDYEDPGEPVIRTLGLTTR
jgi:hypothetical protein